MRPSSILLLLTSLLTLGCQAAHSFDQDGRPIVHQRAITDIACGPSAMFNWMAQGGEDLQPILASLSEDKTPEQIVRQLIDTYGQRTSATNPSVTRYGPHNGGVGSINLMLMARELLDDHLESPPTLRGEYLHRLDGESTREHLDRIRRWFAESIETGIPVLFYIRAYRRASDGNRPGMVFGHHVVLTSFDEQGVTTESGSPRIGFTFVDSGSGRVDRGELLVAERDFTAPTFTYLFEEDRAVTSEQLRTGRPLLEIRVASYESANPPETTILLAHFATFAAGDRDLAAMDVFQQ